MRPLRKLLKHLRDWEKNTRPFKPEKARMLKKRWDALPDHVKTPFQMVGRNSTGCEGTQGVFPKCNFSCTPCYHSQNANSVRIDREHTLQAIEQQMQFLQSERGGHFNYAQLIGGEVTLLGPKTHAEALCIMQQHGRIPMSFTHGDFDYSYLQQLLAHSPTSLKHLSFAGHFDSTMRGRRGLNNPKSEVELKPFREKFCKLFQKLQRETGISYFLAHNMTITRKNLDQVPEVIQQCRHMGFRMMAFQPSAAIGNPKRWQDNLSDNMADMVWALIEQGAGRSLPFQLMQSGDVRCNRTVWGVFIGDSYFPLFETDSQTDIRACQSFREMGEHGMELYRPDMPWLSGIVFLRALLHRWEWFCSFAKWGGRFIHRVGFLKLLLNTIQPMTFVMHNFMDAETVSEAMHWNEKQAWSPAPKIRAAQERLKACIYSMAHPESKQLVPACVQHGLLDFEINEKLRRIF